MAETGKSVEIDPGANPRKLPGDIDDTEERFAEAEKVGRQLSGVEELLALTTDPGWGHLMATAIDMTRSALEDIVGPLESITEVAEKRGEIKILRWLTGKEESLRKERDQLVAKLRALTEEESEEEEEPTEGSE